MANSVCTSNSCSVHPLIGKRFGRLVAVSDFTANERRHFVCECDCGGIVAVSMQSLRRGLTRSCGCLRKDLNSVVNSSHRMSKSKEYLSWQSMKKRCFNKNELAYEQYGEKGITVCSGWKDSFESFFQDLGSMSGRQTIDRIENSRGYTCGHCDECLDRGWTMNCRWATTIEQANNRSNNRMVTIDGVTDTVSGWSRRLGVKYDQAYFSLVRLPRQRARMAARKQLIG